MNKKKQSTSPPGRPAQSEHCAYWGLDPDTIHLNHGSYSACPTAVLEEQSRLRAMLESDPMGFYLHKGVELWQDALRSMSDFLGADQRGMAFVHNATGGVNTVLRSLAFEPGDEIIVCDHAYQACRNVIDYVCKRSDARVVVVPVPFPPDSDEQVVDLFIDAVTARSRLALVDTVSSPTGLKMPFERLTRELQQMGVDVLIDAAHGPGLLPLDLDALGAAYVTGNCHKWLCTPKGSGFLHIRDDRRDRIRPLTVSHGYSYPADAESKFRYEFDWQGTQDPTPWLCIPHAIDHIGGMLDGGWHAIMQRNHELALHAREILCDALRGCAVPPESMISAMAAVELPSSGAIDQLAPYGPDPLMLQLHAEFGIRVSVTPWPQHGARYLRVSSALYNFEDEYEYLAFALRDLVRRRAIPAG